MGIDARGKYVIRVLPCLPGARVNTPFGHGASGAPSRSGQAAARQRRGSEDLASVMMTCPSCGTSAPEGSRFCPSCGHLLDAHVDERRIVTVLFADLVGFTSLSESRDPEQVKNLVEHCFERLAADITAHGGRVDKIMGDEVIALFGAPIAHEDDAERAVRAALQMQRTLAAYAGQASSGEPAANLQLRVGVNTGEVLVGAVRAGEYTAMGDVVNVGSRLRGLADPGTVVVGTETHAATREVITYEPLGALHARGREELVDAWLALDAVGLPGYRPDRTPLPLVGRDEELGMLEHVIAAAAARRRTQLVLLLGEAGLGKSTLAERVAADARVKHGAIVLEGRCVPYGEANPWWPFGEAIRGACGIEPSDPADVSVDKCRAAVARATGLEAASPEVDRLVDGLLYLMGDEGRLADVDPTRARDEARRSLRVFLDALARDRLVVLVLSELHWADPLVLEQVGRLDRVRDLPIVLVGTARPELTDRWQPPIGRNNVLVLQLEPLGPEAMAKLLDAIVPADTPYEVRNLLLERSGGNGFFLVELVALLRDHGALDGRGNVNEAMALDLPATLRGLLSARLDALTPAERGVLADASVVGPTGELEALLALVKARGETGLKAAIESVVAKDLLTFTTPPMDAAGVGGVWEFRSNLLREVAYETLTKAERARRHARLAAWMADRLRELDREDEELEQLAYHYGAAAELVTELGPVDGVPDDIAEIALDWIGRAKDRSDQRDMYLVSLHLVDQALRIVPPGERSRRRTLLLARAGARAALRELLGARADVEVTLADAQADDNSADAARALTILGEIEQKEGRFDDSLATLGRAVEAWQAAGDVRGEAAALRTRGMAHVLGGQPDAAVPDIKQALARFRDVEDKQGEAWALQNLAWAAFSAGHTTKAEQWLDESGRVFTEIGDWGGLGWVLGLLGWVKFQQGHLDEAEALASQILSDIRERGDRWGIAITLTLLACVRLWKGQTVDAIPLATEARELFRALDDPNDELRALGPLARAMVATGRIDEANILVEEAYARGERANHPDSQGFAALMSGTTATHIGDVERALQFARVAAESVDTPRTPWSGRSASPCSGSRC